MADQPKFENLQVISLQAENVKKIQAVQIRPEGAHLVVIAGENAQGKSSVIDSIMYAIEGKASMRDTPKVIRDGETEARIVLDLDDLVVTRVFREGKRDQLTVESKDGSRYTAPQELLDSLKSKLSFDPLEFASMAEKEQLATVLDMLDIDFDPAEVAARRNGVYERRTEQNRVVKRLEAELASIELPNVPIPEEKVELAAIMEEYRVATDRVADHESALRHRKAAEERLASQREEMRRIQEQLEQNMADQAETEAELSNLDMELEQFVAPDIEEIRQRMSDVETTNSLVELKKKKQETAERLAAEARVASQMTVDLEKIDQEKAEAVASAVMPVVGMTFDENGVYYKGQPLGQSSDAERLKVSMAMGMAMNPGLRVLRIKQGSLLDENSMQAVEAMATGNDFQIWVERVGTADAVSVVIEDGRVKDA